METNKIIQGDTLIELKKLPSNLIDTIITSPPYWGLRDYGVEGQIGLEKTLNIYISRLLEITAELKRVLKPTGVMFWNHGDCYSGNSSYSSKGRAGFEEKEGMIKHYLDPKLPARKRARETVNQSNITSKCLVMQNYRLILKMIDQQGWILRNTIVWHKPNHMPSSVKDRFANSYEPVFMLVKNKKYWFDLDAVRVEWTDQRKADIERALRKHPGYKGKRSVFTAQGIKGQPVGNPLKGKNPGDVWKISTQPFPEAHFATFPEKLIEPMILSGCPKEICKKCGKARVRIVELGNYSKEPKRGTQPSSKRAIGSPQQSTGGGMPIREKETLGWTDCKCGKGFEAGIVLDPFFGSGTVAVVAKRLSRNYLGIELSEEYIKIAKDRIKAQPVPLL